MTSTEWGRVDDDGTVYVKTADGERPVGQYPEGSAEEALKFYTDRYQALETEVALLDQRVRAGKLSPDDATARVKEVRAQVAEASAVGDLQALVARLDSLLPAIAHERANRKAEKAQRLEEAKVEKEKLVAEAEEIAAGTDWRHGAHRLRQILEQWKALPRIDRPSDDALWRRFSSARTSYTRARKAHFAKLDEKRQGAKAIKERLVDEAEALADSTDWGPTSGKYRDLMREWKAAGPAPRDVDEQLWQRFRGAQDKFFGARDAANAEQEKEFEANAEVKDGLIAEAEALVPQLQQEGADLDAVKKAFRDLAARWDAAGKVPRSRMKELEGRFRKVEQAIRGVEDEQWRRQDPEKSARADDMISKLEAGIAEAETELAQAREAGNEKLVKELEETLASRKMFLEAAQRASADFS